MSDTPLEFPKTKATLTRLPSGIDLILLPDPDVPVVSVQAWVGTGSVHEEQWLGAGMSHLLEHMVFKGTRSFTTQEMAQTVQAKGGQWNAYTSYDRTVYYIDGPASGVETFVKVVGEMVFHPRFPEEDFETEKDVIRREIEMGLDDPGRAAHTLLFDAIYRQDTRRHPVIGHRPHFDRITHADMVAYHEARYSPDNVTFCIVGDFDPVQIQAQIQDLTEGLQRPFAKNIQLPVEPRQLGQRLAESEFDIPTSKLTLAWRAPGLDHPDAPALDLLASLLGHGRSALLYLKHRECSGLALEITAWNYQSKGMDGIFAISAEVAPEDRSQLSADIIAHLESLTASDFAPHLEKVKRRALSSQFGTLTSASGRASDLAKNWHEAGSLDFTRDYLAQLNALTAEDVEAALKRWIDHTQLTQTSLNPLGTPSLENEQAAKAQRDQPVLHALDNGLRLVLIADNRIPLVAMELCMLGGKAAESPENAGIGMLMASSLLKGTKNRSAEEIATCLEDLGGSISAYSGNNSFGLKASCLKSDIGTCFELTSDLLQHATFPSDAVDRERKSQLADLRQQLSDPLQLAFKTARSGLFKGSPYALPSLGTEESLQSLGSTDLIAHLEKLRSPENCVVSLAGDFDPEAVIKLAEQHFNQLTGEKSVVAPAATSPVASEHSLNLSDKNQGVLCIAFPGLSASDPRRTALDLFASYCSDMAGPLFTRIREELGLAYYVGASQFAGLNTGMLAFYLGTSPDQLLLAKSELLAQLEKLASEGLSEESFERARTNHMASISLARQSNRAVAQASALDTLLGLGHLYHLDAEKRIAALSRTEVNACASSLLAQARVIATVQP